MNFMAYDTIGGTEYSVYSHVWKDSTLIKQSLLITPCLGLIGKFKPSLLKFVTLN